MLLARGLNSSPWTEWILTKFFKSGVLNSCPLYQSYPAAYANKFPFRLKQVEEIGAPTDSDVDSKRCRLSLSQQWMWPSEPAVLKVPHVGWKDIALTGKTWFPSLWHLKAKLLERRVSEWAYF